MSKSKKLGIAAAAAVVAALVIAIIHSAAQQELPEHTPGSAAEIQEHEPEAQEAQAEEEIEVILSEDILLAVVEEELGDTLTLTDLKVSFVEGNRFVLSGNAAKEELTQLLEAQSGSISSAYQSVLTLLPEELPFSMTVQLAAEDGGVTAHLQALSVSSMELSDDMLGEDWLDAFAQGIDRELSKQLDTVTGMTSGIDGIVVTGTANGS